MFAVVNTCGTFPTPESNKKSKIKNKTSNITGKVINKALGWVETLGGWGCPAKECGCWCV